MYNRSLKFCLLSYARALRWSSTNGKRGQISKIPQHDCESAYTLPAYALYPATGISLASDYRNTLLMLHIYNTSQVEANAVKCMPSRSACVAYIIQQMHVYRMYSCTRTSKLRKTSSQAIVVRTEALRNETLYGYQMYRCLKCAFR